MAIVLCSEKKASGFRLQASGYRLPATGYRLQASGYRLQPRRAGILVLGFFLHRVSRRPMFDRG